MPLGEIQVGEGRVADHSGVVHEHVDPPEALADLADKARDVRLVGDVRLDDEAPVTGRLELGSERRDRVALPVVARRDRHAAARECEDDRSSDSARASGDESPLAREFEVHRRRDERCYPVVCSCSSRVGFECFSASAWSKTGPPKK